MDKRYQVFVSSTFADLQEERQEVMQALLELDCIPAGMELFPAANEDQWTLIKKVIDDCDYYIVIVGGRYGSLGPSGLSYTEMEYRHALGQGKPVIGFVHEEPGELAAKRSQQDEAGKQKLEEFRKLVMSKMCRKWNSAADLGSKVSRSLVQLIKAHPATGWVRADLVASGSAAEEMLSLKRQVEELTAALAAANTSAPAGTEKLAQGNDEFDIRFAYQSLDKSVPGYGDVSLTWNEIFDRIAPLMISEASETSIFEEVSSLVEMQAIQKLTEENRRFHLHGGSRLLGFKMSSDDFQTIKIQLRALRLIEKYERPRSVKDQSTYWRLTPYGDLLMTQMRAIERAPDPPEDDD